MKRYEKMTKEEIMKFISVCADCKDCVVPNEECKKHIHCCINKIHYLNEETKLVPRIKKINSVEELEEAYNNFVVNCYESASRIKCENFKKYLKEEVAE